MPSKRAAPAVEHMEWNAQAAREQAGDERAPSRAYSGQQ
jgi:hypothetical protein